MDGYLKDTDRPYQIFATDSEGKSFHSGYMEKTLAEATLIDSNKRAIEMGIKARYTLVEVPIKEEIKNV